MHDDAQINEDTGKPEIIMDYNRTKGGVDSVDKMCETYNVARGTNRWPMVIFYSLMNVAGINTFIIYLQNNPNKKISRRVFLEALAYDLINPQLRRRALISSLPRNIRLRLTEICKLDGPESAATSINNKDPYYDVPRNQTTRRESQNVIRAVSHLTHWMRAVSRVAARRATSSPVKIFALTLAYSLLAVKINMTKPPFDEMKPHADVWRNLCLPIELPSGESNRIV
ncbi:PiggyBac transposable element-derived protein 4 [Eumeta japonica]|uniref:PiggyBac transposable element-derived protein 4 n=1 Tax=Eumeta variegata TaxID=151549 RepID=A0A4C1UHS7_EUMVA|nr:PiggyBac transposable element-derived protein 4 [Eumeta japonica]